MDLGDYVIRQAEATDLTYVMALQRRNRESVGGLPSPAIAERIERRTLLLGILNGDPCGYLMYDYRSSIVRVPQACIQYDARRRDYGTALVGALLALHPAATEVRLRCAADIAANEFWQSLGFTCVANLPGGVRRGRLINVWTLMLHGLLFTPDEVSVRPVWQERVDCMDEETAFPTALPLGFADAGPLPKLAWSNRRDKEPTT